MNKQEKDFVALSEKLLTTTNGSEYHELVRKIVKKFGEKMHKDTLQTLVQAVKESKITHARDFVIARISELATESDTELAPFFYEMIAKGLPYWAFSGLLKVAGAEAYPFLVEYIQKETNKETTGKVILSLAEHCGQPFNYDLPNDPAYWQSLPIDKVLQWQAEGYPQAQPQTGYSFLVQNPQTDLEKVIAKIEKRLEKDRSFWKVNSYEYNRAILEKPEKQIIEAIKGRWQLPTTYLTFLERFSPKNEIFLKGINLYGANTLFEHQCGYAFDSPDDELFPDWQPHWLVIADKDADPYILDLSKSDGNDAPVYKAPHGAGQWKWRKVTGSFLEFLKKL
ncbi:MAG: SMI1/KNR4 family protein [Capnocytophaga sp.]|nr:SMI1/KNR4 family protein [Capnocytophaga sp.]